jgi:two-component system OmpR family sensor kinase
MRTLRGRLTLSYALLLGTLLVIVTCALTYIAFELHVRPQVEAVRAASAEARAIAAASPGESIVVLGPRIVAETARPGVIVRFQGHPPEMRLGGPPPGLMPFGLPGPPGMRPDGGAPGAGPPELAPPGMREVAPAGPPVRRLETPRGFGFLLMNTLFGVHPDVVPVMDGAVIVMPDVRAVDAVVRHYLAALAIELLLGVVAAWAIARWIAGQAMAPLTDVTAQLRRFAAGDFEPRPVTTTDRTELGQLSEAYNAASAQVASAFEERKYVEDYMRRFVADAGHELRTPLSVVGAYVDILRKGGLDDAVLRERAFGTLGTEIARMRELTDRLIALARLERPEPPARERLDLSEVARAAIEVATTVRGGDVTLAAPAPVPVDADEAELHEAIANLVDNALKYGRGAPVAVSVRAEGGEAVVRVTDAGPGIAAEDRDHVFERFYRGQDRGVSGSGLGLAIVVRAAQRAGGRATLESGAPGATAFALHVPLALETPAAGRG